MLMNLFLIISSKHTGVFVFGPFSYIILLLDRIKHVCLCLTAWEFMGTWVTILQDDCDVHLRIKMKINWFNTLALKVKHLWPYRRERSVLIKLLFQAVDMNSFFTLSVLRIFLCVLLVFFSEGLLCSIWWSKAVLQSANVKNTIGRSYTIHVLRLSV